MTNIQEFSATSAALLVAGLLASPLFTSGAEASTTSRLMNCASNNMGKTIDCCESVVRGSVPIWMKTTGRNCAQAVKCTGGSGKYTATTAAPLPKKRCTIVVHLDDVPGGGGGGERPMPQRNPGRTPGLR